ncbi:hypothetical protein INT43_002757 [Umbelopsis isabellina]|uniref:Transmembrane protein 242 n=1 Tax=Mortierella isabellina TaxID=91625 RepID=A0A8H7Q734_MORIS|nr:hypothetical protein INT43_002757 [Umbelopsis isabellina]
MSTDTKAKPEPPIRTSTLLTAAGSLFVVGLAGSIWQANRKHAREMQADAAAAAKAASQEPTITPGTKPSIEKPNILPQPVMTAAEYAQSRVEARFYSLRAFGYGTLLAFGGVGALAAFTAWWFEVSSMEELSQKLQDTIPKHTTALRTKILREETIHDELSMLPNIERKLSAEDLSAEEWWKELKKEWQRDVQDRREWHTERDARDRQR